MPAKPKPKRAPRKRRPAAPQKDGPKLLAGPPPAPPSGPRPAALVHPIPVSCISEELMDRIWKAAGSPAIPFSELPFEIQRLRGFKAANRKLLDLIERLAAEVPRSAENEDLLLDAQRALE